MPPDASLRVAMLVFNEVGRGTYFRALGFARALAARGHQLSVLAMSRTARWKVTERTEEGVRIVEFPDWLWGPLRSGWDPVETLARLRWLSHEPFDVVHAFESRPTVIVPALYATRQHRAALVMDWCDWFGAGGSVEMRPNPLVRTVLRPVESWFEEHFRTQAAGTTVINSVLRDKALALGVAPESILWLPNGADSHRLRPIPRAEARQRLGLPHEPLLIGYVGSAFPVDLDLMGAAFDRLHALRPGVKLLRLGQHTYPLLAHLRDTEALLEPGYLSEEALNLHLAACDLFWLPLVNTGANRGRMPAKLLDYLCIGRPVVATRVGDIETLFEQEKLGRLADDTPEDVVRQTLALLDEEPTAHQHYHLTGQRLIRECFNWDRQAGRLEHHYFSALRHHP
ncbi:MAG: glycosyltransferase [Ardenticatenales bacterium]|nr:glycosyltransferase [Ardenticatenales bacterium]